MSKSWFYTNLYLDSKSNKIYIKGYKQDGTPIKGVLDFKPFCYVPSRVPTHYTLEGEGVIRKDFDNLKLLEKYIRDGNKAYGMGIGSEFVNKNELLHAFIVDTFKENIVYNTDYIKVFYYDIETTSEEGFPNYNNPVEEILSISTIFTVGDKVVFKTFGTKSCNHKEVVDFTVCENEEDMLTKFCQYFSECEPDIISGWNIQRFDTPYLVSRIQNYYDKDILKLLSPFRLEPKKVLKKVKHQRFKTEEEYDIYIIHGVSDLDYYNLYSKFETKYSGSMKLDEVAFYELKERKVDYSEYGSLKNLYKNDYDKFIYYNQRDTVLVHKIAEKRGFHNIAITIAYICKTFYENSLKSVPLWDNMIYDELLNHRNIIIPHKKFVEKNRQNEGAFVKPAQLGLFGWGVSTDAKAEYPSTVRSLNISFDTFVRKININKDDYFDKKYNTTFLKEQNLCMSANGCLFRTDKQGVIPYLMEKVQKDRDYYKSLMLEEKKKKDKNLSLISKYDSLQNALKILGNSGYGTVTSDSFRYYDMDIGEAITITAQILTRSAMSSSNKVLNDYLNTSNKDYILQSDTDSCFTNLSGVIKKENPENVVDFIDNFCKEILDKQVNKDIEELAIHYNFFQNHIYFKREKIFDSIVIYGKKRYFCNVWDEEGVRYEEPKFSVTGNEIVQTKTPEPIKNALKDCLKIILQGSEKELQSYIKQFKNEYKSLDAYDITSSISINGLDKYVDSNGEAILGTPGQVKAAIIYNKILKELNLENELELIKNGDKVKMLLLKFPNKFHNDRIVFKDFLDKRLGIENFIDYNRMFEDGFEKPLERILDVIGWSLKTKNTF